ncbi:MAG TPA: four helix bundle protein [Longimicrobiales bacterium]
MAGFDHERLEVYHLAMRFADAAERIAATILPERRPLADQLTRAAASIPLNIAEGAAESRRAEKARFYRIARRSAAECAAIIELIAVTPSTRRPGRPQSASLDQAEHLLVRISAILAALIRTFSRPA